MKKSVFGWIVLIAMCIAGRPLVAAQYNEYTFFDWFGVSFDSCALGEVLTKTSGVQRVGGELSGEWSIPAKVNTEIVSTIDYSAKKSVKFDTYSLLTSGIAFDAAKEAADVNMSGYRVDTALTFGLLKGRPTMSSNAKAALALVAEEGETNLCCYVKSGWKKLFSPVTIEPGVIYETRAEFTNLNGSRYVTFSLKFSDEYQALTDDMGNTEFKIPAEEAVNIVEFRGDAKVESLKAETLKSSGNAGDIIAPGVPKLLTSWFDVQMSQATAGEQLAEKTGVIGDSGTWQKEEECKAVVVDDGGMRYLSYGTASCETVGPVFSAARAGAGDYVEIEFSMRFANDDRIIKSAMPAGTKAAMTIADVDGVPHFFGYGKSGWVSLTCEAMRPEYLAWYDLVAVFEKHDNVLFVSYVVRTFGGYVAMADASGNTLIEAAGANEDVPQQVGFVGEGELRYLTGTEIFIDPEHAYHWIGPYNGDWHCGTNWSHTAGGVPLAADDVPKATDAMIINTRSSIRITSDIVVSNLVLNADLAIEGSEEVRSTYNPTDGTVNGLAGDQISFHGIYGRGKLSTRNVVLKGLADVTKIDTPLVIVDDSTTGFYCDERKLMVNGDVSGSGAIIAYQSGDNRGVTFSGYNGEFAGVYTETVFGDRDFGRTRFSDGEASMPKAIVNLQHTLYADPSTEQSPFGTADDTYRFGAYNGHLATAKSVPTVIIGGRNEDCTIDGIFACGERSKPELGYWLATLIKVGTARLVATNMSNIGYLDLRDGETVLASAQPMYLEPLGTISFNGGTLLCDTRFDPSAHIANSTGAITFNDAGNDNIWQTRLGSSNVGGLVKRGAGTLTLTEIPVYMGDTVVEEGALIVPCGTKLSAVNVKSGARFRVDLSGMTSEDEVLFYAEKSSGLETDPKKLFINVPQGVELPQPTFLDDGGVLYAYGGKVFTWTGLAGDCEWANFANWSTDGHTATTIPGSKDVVKVPAGKSPIVVRTSTTVVMVSCEEGAAPFEFVSPAISNENYSVDDTTVFRVTSGPLPNFTGVGRVEIADEAILDIAEGDTARFIGSITSSSFTKRGKGTAVLAGVNAFGVVNIEEGTLKIGTWRDIDDLRFDFDASTGEGYTLNPQGGVYNWESSVGGDSMTYAGGEYASVSNVFINGLRALRMRPKKTAEYSSYSLTPANSASKVATKSLFAVYSALDLEGGSYLYSDSIDTSRGMKIRGEGDYCYWAYAADASVVGFYTGAEPISKQVYDGVPTLTSWLDMPMRSTASVDVTEVLGGSATTRGFSGAIGELVGYKRSLAHAERLAAQRSLMRKWGVLGDGYAVLPENSSFTMGANAVLDLSGLSQLVAGFAGAGVVSNGVLLTANGMITAVGGALTVPAVEGMVYVLADRKAKLVLTGAAGKAVTIVVPESCMSAKVFCEGEITWRLGSDAIVVSGPDAGWYSLTNMGGGATIIIR